MKPCPGNTSVLQKLPEFFPLGSFVDSKSCQGKLIRTIFHIDRLIFPIHIYHRTHPVFIHIFQLHLNRRMPLPPPDLFNIPIDSRTADRQLSCNPCNGNTLPVHSPYGISLFLFHPFSPYRSLPSILRIS